MDIITGSIKYKAGSREIRVIISVEKTLFCTLPSPISLMIFEEDAGKF